MSRTQPEAGRSGCLVSLLIFTPVSQEPPTQTHIALRRSEGRVVRSGGAPAGRARWGAAST